ncbi:lanthionine synthetase LanC family protein, partial [Stomatobaculum longum]
MKAQAVKSLIKPMFRMPAKEDYLKAALRVARWLRANAERTEAGIHWFEDPMHPEGETVMGEFSVYSGMPGPILFLLELSKITGDISWREEACLAADYLLANFDEGRKMQTDMGVLGSEIGPISGTAGLSFVFTELGKATGEQKYLDFAAAETEKIAALAKRVGEGVEWLGEPGGISYDAGIALYLLYEAKVFGREDWRTLAIFAAKRLLEQAVKTEGGAYKWRTITVPN